MIIKVYEKDGIHFSYRKYKCKTYHKRIKMINAYITKFNSCKTNAQFIDKFLNDNDLIKTIIFKTDITNTFIKELETNYNKYPYYISIDYDNIIIINTITNVKIYISNYYDSKYIYILDF